MSPAFMTSTHHTWNAFPESDMPSSLFQNEKRRERLAEERRRQEQFVSGDELQELRQTVLMLRNELRVARQLGATMRIQELERAILLAQQADAEFVYKVNLEMQKTAETEGRFVDAQKYKRLARNARAALPQFNLEGLWVGKYGDHGFEMINVTYAGDTLVAHKVTGDHNVPKGEVSFCVDLSCPEADMEPVELGREAAERWGSKFLPRFSGEGQVSATDFQQPQWVEGQLILVNQYFSFAWLPIGHQVFFGRPSAELTLKLLRNDGDAIRNYLDRCWEESAAEGSIDVDSEVYDVPETDYYNQEGCFE